MDKESMRRLLDPDNPEGEPEKLEDRLKVFSKEIKALRERGWTWEKIWLRLREGGLKISRSHFQRLAGKIVGESENSRSTPAPEKKPAGKEEPKKSVPTGPGKREIPPAGAERTSLPPPAPNEVRMRNSFVLEPDTDL